VLLQPELGEDRRHRPSHSHSMVAGGFELTS
jgi:hypothetical protein